jgi:hypothetical protein
MSFLDATPDLSPTIFSPLELAWARKYLVELLEREDPAWLVKPTGYLARFWLNDDTFAVCYLIELARLLNRLELGGVAPEAKPVLFKKLHQLLRKTPQKAAFEETLTELQLAAFLTETAQPGPLLLEPRLLELKPQTGAKPRLAPVSGQKVIDLALPLADQILFVEVTVLNFEALNSWLKLAQHLATLFQKTFWLENLSRQVEISLPFPASAKLLDEGLVKDLLTAVTTSAEGKRSHQLTTEAKVGLHWHVPSKQIEERVSFPLFRQAAPTLGFTQGEVSCVMAQENLTQFDEWLLKSLRNSLKIKKEQCRFEPGSLLVIKPGSSLLSPNKLLELVERRLWSNSRYRWLSGLGIFSPRTGFAKTEPGPRLMVLLNPQAHFLIRGSALQFLQTFEAKFAF